MLKQRGVIPLTVFMMLGILYASASDFSAFSYPRSACTSAICYETHSTAIEERYCPKQHFHRYDDKEWEDLLACSVGVFNESEPDPLPEDHANDSDGENSVPLTPVSSISTPSLICDGDAEGLSTSSESELEEDQTGILFLACTTSTGNRAPAMSNGRKRKRGKTVRSSIARKRLCRASSTASISTVSSVASAVSSSSSMSQLRYPYTTDSENPWKCPHCPWIQHTQRLPDFLRHQRSHFVSQSDWPCPNPKCGKGFARKDSLKRHLDNKSTGCKRPPGYVVC